jgi:hypothetical protein
MQKITPASASKQKAPSIGLNPGSQGFLNGINHRNIYLARPSDKQQHRSLLLNSNRRRALEKLTKSANRNRVEKNIRRNQKQQQN